MQKIENVIWDSKYRHKQPDGSSTEENKEDSYLRVVQGVFSDREQKAAQLALDEMINERWVPAGRIQAGAGTQKRVTWINCYVSPTIQDSMDTEGEIGESAGIMDALKIAALTQQMGGGIGMDFSTLRPRGAVVGRTGSVSSGPLHFMDMWHSMCSTVMSSGSRRGAMMGTMRIDHPDILDFINAKHKHGRLTNFNVSVLVTDAFMAALENDEDWDLGFGVPRADGQHVAEITERKGRTAWYVYRRVRARELWDKITESTYRYSEPGIIFIDRVNQTNSLSYCETIACTNPCGEQPLPPNGDCNLGAVNLARMVLNSFMADSTIDWDQLKETTKVGVRFLDNVLDHTPFPTLAQAEEARQKRRIGLGITGLGNMLQQLRVRYGSKEAQDIARKVMFTIANAAYQESAFLAKQRGWFPKYDETKHLRAPFVQKLSTETQELIALYGLRNGVLLTVAPTGTTSILIGNVSSGCEPTFAWTYNRKVRKPHGDGEDTFEVQDYGYRMYCDTVLGGKKPNGEGLPDYMVTATELSVEEHLLMQAALQEFVDASISKTINCPEDMTLADFRHVYTRAWDLGLKGCTTYRPSDVRGSVLSVIKPSVPTVGVLKPVRPEKLDGSTYKVRWGTIQEAFYVTINNTMDEVTGKIVPFEIFINSKSVQHQEWIAALTRMMSAVMRRGGDLTFMLAELEQVHSTSGGQWQNGTYVPSLVALIGLQIRKHMVNLGMLEVHGSPELMKGSPCPKCGVGQYISESGCKRCLACGHSSCE